MAFQGGRPRRPRSSWTAEVILHLLLMSLTLALVPTSADEANNKVDDLQLATSGKDHLSEAEHHLCQLCDDGVRPDCYEGGHPATVIHTVKQVSKSGNGDDHDHYFYFSIVPPERTYSGSAQCDLRIRGPSGTSDDLVRIAWPLDDAQDLNGGGDRKKGTWKVSRYTDTKHDLERAGPLEEGAYTVRFAQGRNVTFYHYSKASNHFSTRLKAIVGTSESSFPAAVPVSEGGSSGELVANLTATEAFNDCLRSNAFTGLVTPGTEDLGQQDYSSYMACGLLKDSVRVKDGQEGLLFVNGSGGCSWQWLGVQSPGHFRVSLDSLRIRGSARWANLRCRMRVSNRKVLPHPAFDDRIPFDLPFALPEDPNGHGRRLEERPRLRDQVDPKAQLEVLRNVSDAVSTAAMEVAGLNPALGYGVPALCIMLLVSAAALVARTKLKGGLWSLLNRRNSNGFLVQSRVGQGQFSKGVTKGETHVTSGAGEVSRSLLEGSGPDSKLSLAGGDSEEVPAVARLLPPWVKPNMILPSRSIQEIKVLGYGQFGVVLLGTFTYGTGRWHVAIKSNRATKVGTAGKVGALDDHDDDHDDDGLPALLDEAKTMLEIGGYHDNIVNLQGIIAEQDGHSVTKLSLVLEYCSHGDIRSYILQRWAEFDSHCRGLRPECVPASSAAGGNLNHDLRLLVNWSYQVACGMEFLSSKNIYHGDLAARNVLLTDCLVAKVSDFGLSSRLYNSPDACLGDNGCRTSGVKLPMKWLALEVLMHFQVSTKSDVWSYGVFLWELFQLGDEPYGKANDFESFVQDLLKGVRLPMPELCPDPNMHHLMQCCWLAQPSERPTFRQVVECLLDWYANPSSSQATAPPSPTCSVRYLTLLNETATSTKAMREQYTFMQSWNPVYTLMDGKSSSSN